MKGGMFCRMLLLSAVVALPVQAAVYRWTDAQGRPQFSDRPPPNGSAEELRLKTAPAPGGDAPATEQQRRELRRKMLDAYQEEREEKRRARERQAKEQTRRRMACAEAKNRVRDYEAASGLYRLQPDGSREYLSDAEFRVSLQRARDEVKRLCRPGG